MKTSPGRASDLQSALGAWGGRERTLPRTSSSDSFRIAALREQERVTASTTGGGGDGDVGGAVEATEGLSARSRASTPSDGEANGHVVAARGGDAAERAQQGAGVSDSAACGDDKGRRRESEARSKEEQLALEKENQRLQHQVETLSEQGVRTSATASCLSAVGPLHTYYYFDSRS